MSFIRYPRYTYYLKYICYFRYICHSLRCIYYFDYYPPILLLPKMHLRWRIYFKYIHCSRYIDYFEHIRYLRYIWYLRMHLLSGIHRSFQIHSLFEMCLLFQIYPLSAPSVPSMTTSWARAFISQSGKSGYICCLRWIYYIRCI